MGEKIERIVTTRKCTDVGCLVCFLCFVVTFAVLLGYATTHGDVEKLLAPLDGDNLECGLGDRADYPKLFLTKLEF